MAVNDGEVAKASIFNAAFVSRIINSTIVSKLGLFNTDSGGNITNVQQSINNNTTGVADNVSAISVLSDRIDPLEASTAINKYDAIVPPTSTNDTTENYGVGSSWIDITNGGIYRAFDVTEDAAIWKRLDTIMLEIDQTYFNNSISVDDSVWVELIANTGSNVIRKIQSFYAAGSVAMIGIGAAASEAEIFILQPGGNGESGLPVNIPINSRVSIKLKSGEDALVGAKIALNLFKES